VVGPGYWGPNLARNFERLDGVELAWLCDSDPAALARAARNHPNSRTTTRFADVLADDHLDAVAIATRVASHYALAAEGLDAGKHVFVEKPLAGSSAECAALIAAAAERNLVLMPGHTFLYSPPVVAIKRLIDAGTLGSIHFISTSRVNLGIHQSDVSVAWDLAPHDFSILRYWLDEVPASVSATARACVVPDVADVVFVTAVYGSGMLAHAELSWLAPTKLRRTTVAGSRKMVLYDDTSTEPVRIYDSGVESPMPDDFGEYRLTYRTGDIVSPHVSPAEPLALELADFVRAVVDGHTPRSSAAVGLDIVRVVEAILRSADRGGAPVDVRPAPHPPPAVAPAAL
jgi:predicted dehydrogenase